MDLSIIAFLLLNLVPVSIKIMNVEAVSLWVLSNELGCSDNVTYR